MKDMTRFGEVGILLLPFLLTPGQQQSTTVHIKVIHDGHQVAAPTMIKVKFDSHSLRIPVRDGKFESPPTLIAAKSVTVETDVADSHIRLTQIPGFNFTGEWTLRIAEHVNVDYYDWRWLKGADIPASCMLEFDTGHEEPGRIKFQQNCRSKRK